MCNTHTCNRRFAGPQEVGDALVGDSEGGGVHRRRLQRRPRDGGGDGLLLAQRQRREEALRQLMDDACEVACCRVTADLVLTFVPLREP